MREIRSKIPPKFPGSTFYFQSADIVTQVLNFGLPAPIDVQVQDFNFERGQRYAGRLRKAIEEVPGAVDVRQLQVLNYPGLRVEVDRLRAARLGFTQRDVANSLLTSLVVELAGQPVLLPGAQRRQLRGGGADADREDHRRGRPDVDRDHRDHRARSSTALPLQSRLTADARRGGDASVQHRHPDARDQLRIGQPLHRPARDRHGGQRRRPRPGQRGSRHPAEDRRRSSARRISRKRSRSSCAGSTT